MWVELERMRRRIPNLLTEVAIRVFLILIVCLMQVNVKPHLHHITESEFQNYMKPRKDSFVPPWMMVVIIVFVPLILLSLPYLLTRNYEDTAQALLAWTLALTINAIVTESTKLLVGRPRPDFYFRCFPTGTVTVGFHCTGNVRDVMEGRKSFPSGHSSFAFCSMGFLSIWLCGRLRVLSWCRGESLRVVVCLLPLVLASAVAVSRCCDNHHHWEDVLVGSALGFFSSYVCYRQYYNPLDSELSGYPYLVTEDVSFDSSEIGCSTDELNVFLTGDNQSRDNIKSDKKYS
ncbi:phospholipid phosphatase 5-like [Ostrinia furnacalis]|uniref:phospholipid phosphatase 5-like n=1 Tax=Ostrinia furnacalis TaxID=93504 RepID=UPI00104067EC|nr:phospholipid phosphatase 5-like [Ostrinia furnacalis]